MDIRPVPKPGDELAHAITDSGRPGWLEGGRWMVAPALVILIVLAAVFLRQIEIPKYRTMWAEDGRLFAQCLFDRPALECLTEPYQGYVLTVPRLAAMIATAGPPATMPLLFTLMAGLVAAWCGATVAIAIREVTASTTAGILAGVSLALVWQAGREVLGNVTNVNAVMLVASIVVIVCGWLGRRLRPWDLALIAATALSSALALLLPILAVGAVVARTRHARRHLALIAAFAIPQTFVLITTTRFVPDRQVTVVQAVTGFRDLVLGQGWFGGQTVVPDVVVPLSLVGFAVALVLLARLPDRDAPDSSADPGGDPSASRLVSDARLAPRLLVLAALVTIGTAIFIVSVFLNRGVTPRYGYAPAAMISIAVALAGGWVVLEGRRRTFRSTVDRRAAGPASPTGADLDPAADGGGLGRVTAVSALVVVLLIAVGFGMSFRLQSRASSGPNVVSAINLAGHDCGATTERVTVPISPKASPQVWTMEIPCSRLAP